MPITWEYFTKRFSISTEEFIRKYDCKSYEDLCSKINHDDILPPAESEVKSLFSVAKQEAPKEPPARRKPAQKKQSLGTKSSSQNLSRQEIRKRAQAKKAKPAKAKEKTEEKSE